MESKSQNSQSPADSSASAQPAQATGAAGKSTPKSTSRAESVGTEQISGLNGLDSLAQTRGRVEQLGQLNSQTGAAGKAHAALSSEAAPVAKSSASEWQSALQSTLQQGWTALANRVRTATPTQIAIGAAAVGAAVWLGTRKRSGKGASSGQTFADRWTGYPSGSDGSRNDGAYGRTSSQSRSQTSDSSLGGDRDARNASLSSDSQTTKGPASGPYGQSGETWQRPSDERWDD